jgi:RHS repeat-associated protein
LGRNISKTDQAGKVTQFAYDSLSRLTSVTDALNQVTSYSYDELGNQLTQTDALNRTTRYEYDKLGRRIKRTLPLGQVETYSYNTVGNLLSRTDFKGKVTTYAYDTMNRLLSKTPDASLSEPSITFTYNSLGQRLTMNDSSGVTTYGYDVRNRLTSKQTPQGTLSYSYDNASNLLTTRSSNVNGVNTSYSYDALNRLNGVTDNAPVTGTRSATGASSMTYDAVGNLSSVTTPNGVSHSYTYNNLNRLTNVSLSKGATTLASYAYTLGAAGNRLSVTEQNGRVVSYSYDALYRLTQEQIANDPIAANNGTLGYSYDAVGNRLSRASTITAVASSNSTYDNNDRLSSDAYDANGNTVSSNGNGYGYDFENRLLKLNAGTANEVSYVYDGDGNRVSKTVGGVTTKYLVDVNNLTGYAQVVEEIVSGAVQRVYVYGHMRISQQQFISGNWQASYYGYDGHSSVRYLTDATGVVTDSYTYDAFGALIHQTGTTPNAYLYAGEQFDTSLGLYYNRARYLNTNTGRFWTMDAYEGDRYDPASLHKYTYASSDPINGTDPSGFLTIKEAMTIVTVVSVLSNLGLAGYHLYRASQARTPEEAAQERILAAINLIGALMAAFGGGFIGPTFSAGATAIVASNTQLGLAIGSSILPVILMAANSGSSGGGSSSGGSSGSSSTGGNSTSQSFKIGGADHLGRPTGVWARITKSMLRTGSDASVDPTGWQPGMGGTFHRGHLWSKLLGGPGNDRNNLVPLHSYANTPVMREFERAVARAVEAGEIMDYTAIPTYVGDSLIPRSISLKAIGDRGFQATVDILNIAK